MQVACWITSTALDILSVIPGPVGTACGVGAKVADGIGMLTGGAAIKQVIKHVAKEVAKEVAVQMVGGKMATKATKLYEAKKGVEIAKTVGKTKQIVQQAKTNGKLLDYGVRGAAHKLADLTEKLIKKS